MTYSTYCMDDDKLRLYVGRVPREEYLKLKAEGWTSTPKQSCDFVATWTPERRDTALEYGGGVIEDEDQSPEDRAADRAERFGGYRDKRLSEAVGHADRYEAGPQGFQSALRAEKSVARHERVAGRACDAWSKAEYWQQRTAGVISRALYKSSPGVRMGRIKTLEAELRAKVATYEKAANLFDYAVSLRDIENPEEQTRLALQFFGSVSSYREYPHPDLPEEKHSVYTHMTSERRRKITGKEAIEMYLSDRTRPDVENNDWANHYKLRLAYENQMLAAQGGRLEQCEVVPGGKLGGKLIIKVAKSNATGRVTSAKILGPKVQGWAYKTTNIPGTEWAEYTFDLERLAPDAYTPPTPESLAELEAFKKAVKAAKPEKAPCPLVNPTDKDAEMLQALWNSKAQHPSTVLRMTQAQYSANSGGTYSRFETVTIGEHGSVVRQTTMGHAISRCEVFKVRVAPSEEFYGARRVIVITDKPQKAIPLKAMEAARAAQPTIESMTPRLPEIQAALACNWLEEENRPLLKDAEYVGWVKILSMSHISWTEEGAAAYKAFTAELVNA